MDKVIYCNNCGKRGHISKYCNIPITSYGVLLFVDNDIPKITMIQRKDSLCYIEIIRGKYDIYDIESIKDKTGKPVLSKMAISFLKIVKSTCQALALIGLIWVIIY